MIWKVSGKEKYFCGSIHILPKGEIIDSRLLALASKMERVYFEGDLDAKPQLPLVIPIQLNLEHRLNPITYQRLQRLLNSLGIMEPLSRLRPFHVWGLLIYGISIKNNANVGGIDRAIWNSISADKRLFLERVGEAEKIFSESDFNEQLDFISNLSEQGMKEEYQLLFSAWKKADNKGVASFFEKKTAAHPSIWNNLIRVRNARWTDKITASLKDDIPTMFVIGAAHVVCDEAASEWCEAEHQLEPWS